MRVLVTSWPGTGHIHPLVPLSAELQSAGHDVLWATGADACAMVERYGFRAVSAGGSTRDRPALPEPVSALAAASPVRERRRVLMPTIFGGIGARLMRDDLVRVVDDYRPDVIIHDMVEFASAPVASARGIPHVTLAFGTALPAALLAAVAPAVAQLWADEGLVPSADVGVYDHLYLHPLPLGFGQPPSAGTVRSVRPMHFDGGGVVREPDWVGAFGRDRPGVYVTFGTVMSAGAPWAAVIEAAGGLDADVVMTVGSKVDPAALGAVPENVRVEAYVPQTYLLNRAALVVSHSGAGTLFAAAARGIPQLCLPMGADQWENADALARTGSGITLEPEERQPDVIRRAVVSLLDGPEHRRAAKLLADEFAVLPHPGEHVTTIEALT